MPKIPRILLAFLSLLFLSACSFSLAEDVTPPPGSEQFLPQEPEAISDPLYPIVPPDPVAGALVYADHCAPCHGVSGMGDGPSTSELTFPVAAIGSAQVARAATPAGWYTVITEGNMERSMPSFPGLSDREKWDVIAYVYTLSAPERLLAQGQALYLENCADCHGQTGRGDGPQAASLAISPRDLQDQAWMAGRSNASLYDAITNGLSPEMPAFAIQLNDEQRWALVSYIRSLTFATQPGSQVSATEQTPEPYPAPQPYPAPADQPVAASSLAQPQQSALGGMGSVVVELVSGSGGKLAEGLVVTLYGYDNMSQVYSQTLEIGEDGRYLFTDVEMPLGRAFLAGVEYGGSIFASDVIVVETGPQDLNLPVMVYDTSTDETVLSVDRIHVFIDFLDAENAQVIEVYIISNPTNRSVIAEEKAGPVVFFPLPAGAIGLQFQDGVLGERYLELPGGFADTMPVDPGMGKYQVVVAFTMPYDRMLEFTQPLQLKTEAILVMLPDVGVKLKSDTLQDGGMREFQGTSYKMYTSGSLEAGSQLSFSVSGRPQLSGGTSLIEPSTTQNLAIGIGVFGLVLLLAGVWLYRRNKLQGTEADLADVGAALPAVEQLPDDPDTLLDAIVALDELYESGQLPEEAYQTRRTALKSRLKDLLGS
ncbi:MAG: c-type cytochrome [Anaerolineales bacterium]|nr:c-type cytochrome [Anaerolineales bacterium]